MAQCKLDNLPDTSPAKWFQWSAPSAHTSSPLMPADDDVHYMWVAGLQIQSNNQRQLLVLLGRSAQDVWRHLGSVLLSECRQRHRQCLESGPRFSLQCWWWCGHQCGGVLPFQWRERSHVNTSACSSGSTSSADVETRFSSKLLPFL